MKDTKVNSLDIANFFNTYFSQVGENALNLSNNNDNNQSTNSHQQSNSSGVVDQDGGSELYFSNVTSKEIEEVISGMKGRTAPGHDGIKTDTLKCIKNYISGPLIHIFNLCFRKGFFPNQFKHAIICPMYKKGPHHLVQNY